MNWQAAVDSTVTGLGYDLVDCERTPRGLLRVYIDHLPASASKPESAALPGAVAAGPGVNPFITVEDCERVTRQLQRLLEVENIPYERLEVSSPGLDRPLKKAADYARFAGEQVEVTLKAPFNGRKKYSGVLEQVADVANGGGWRLVFNDGEADQAFDFSLEEVRGARLVPVVDFKGRRFAPLARELEADAALSEAALMPQANAEDHGGLDQ